MARSKGVRRSAGKLVAAEDGGMTPWQVGQITGKLVGDLKNAQVAYIRVCVGLARVRDEKLYAIIKDPDLETYALNRLHLGTASLYRYLQVYDWIRDFHPQWFDPHPKERIPNLSDVPDLIWIERELAKTDLDPKARAELEDLQRKALDGRLKRGEVSRYRRRGRQPTDDALKSLLSRLRSLRRYAAQAKTTPPEALSKMDDAIAIVLNAVQSHPIALAFGDEFPRHVSASA